MSNPEEIRHAVDRLNLLERRELFNYLQRTDGLLHTGGESEDAHADCVSSVLNYLVRDEFLEIQEKSSIPYEYINGVIRQITDPSVAHCMVTQNLCNAIRTRLRGRQCEVFSSGSQLNLTVGNDKIVYRPDLFVMCEKGASEGGARTPKLVVEVISPSTQHVDKREKLANYRRVLSVDEYVVAAQKCAELTVYRRTQDWAPEVVNSLRASAELHSLGLSIPLVEIYERVFSSRTAFNSEL